MVKRRLPRHRTAACFAACFAARFAGGLFAAALMVLSAAPAGSVEAVECWRGWGYFSDPETQTYTSGEMLLVTRGAAEWRAGLPVDLYLLDRASGAIVADRPPMTVIPSNPRIRYRGRANYVDGRAIVLGVTEVLVFGMSHVSKPASALEAMADFNRWACGLSARK